jgi:hypothetical protein
MFSICFFSQAANLAKRSSGGLFTVGDVLANRTSTNETTTIESKTMAMTFTKTVPDGTRIYSDHKKLDFSFFL